MKAINLFLLTILAFWSCQSTKTPTGTAPKEILIPNEVTISKLRVDHEDKTDHLGEIRITERQWSEYDREGNVIGVADVESVNNHTISIKWTMAENGADVGDRTIYEYHLLDDKVLFTIWYDKEQRGYFEGQLKNR